MHPQVTRKVCDKCAKEHKHACNHFDSMTQAKLEDKANNHLESDTEYRINYIRKIVEPTKGQPVPQMLHVGDGKFEGTSTNHSDYKNFGQQARVKYIIPGKNVNSIDVRNNTKFEGVSSHKQDFKKFEKYNRPMPHVQAEYVNHEDDRDFFTTNHADFKNFGPQKRIEHQNNSNETTVKPTDSKFEGISSHRNDFIKFEQYKRPAGRPVIKFNSPVDDRDFKTTKVSDFKEFGIQKRFIAPNTGFNSTSVVVSEGARFEGVSTNKQDFQKWGNYKRPPGRKQADFISPSEDRDFVTTIHSDFKQFDVQKKIVHAPFNDTSFVDQNNNKFEAKSVNKQDFVKWENYKVPTRRKQMQAFVSSQDERDFNTTASATYLKLPMSKTVMFKPKHVFLPAQSLEGASCTREDYKVWPLPPRVHKLKAQFKPSEGQIDQNTSYTLAFTEEVFKKTVKVKPVGPVYAPINQDTKFEGSSTARTDYPNFKNVERTKSFMPRLLYNPAPEDRDFMSVSGMDYTKKFVPRGFATTPEAVAHAVVPASQSAEQTTPVVAL